MIAVISDTHENVKQILAAVALIKPLAPTLVVHCGDIISPPTLEHFAGLPMRFVYGNNDGERAGLARKCAEMGFGEIGDELQFEIAGKKFHVYHGTSERTLRTAIDAQDFDYVLCGHTHSRRDEKVGRTRVINPGALYSAASYSFATLDVERDTVKFIELPK